MVITFNQKIDDHLTFVKDHYYGQIVAKNLNGNELLDVPEDCDSTAKRAIDAANKKIKSGESKVENVVLVATRSGGPIEIKEDAITWCNENNVLLLSCDVAETASREEVKTIISELTKWYGDFKSTEI